MLSRLPVAQAPCEHCYRVIVIIRHHQFLAITRNGQPAAQGCTKTAAVYRRGRFGGGNREANTRRVIQEQFRLLRRGPRFLVGAQRKDVDVVMLGIGRVRDNRCCQRESRPCRSIRKKHS